MTGVPRKLRVPDVAAMKQRGERALPWSRDFSRKHIAEWDRLAVAIRREEILGEVPTMGALHDGHGALLDEARKRCSVVVATIFVNPIPSVLGKNDPVALG